MFGIIFLVIAVVLSVLSFKVLLDFGMHWGVCLVLATVPVVATYFFGIIGLIGSALLVGALYKASAG
jgi:hypothetical protein